MTLRGPSEMMAEGLYFASNIYLNFWVTHNCTCIEASYVIMEAPSINGVVHNRSYTQLQ